MTEFPSNTSRLKRQGSVNHSLYEQPKREKVDIEWYSSPNVVPRALQAAECGELVRWAWDPTLNVATPTSQSPSTSKSSKTVSAPVSDPLLEKSPNPSITMEDSHSLPSFSSFCSPLVTDSSRSLSSVGSSRSIRTLSSDFSDLQTHPLHQAHVEPLFDSPTVQIVSHPRQLGRDNSFILSSTGSQGLQSFPFGYNSPPSQHPRDLLLQSSSSINSNSNSNTTNMIDPDTTSSRLFTLSSPPHTQPRTAPATLQVSTQENIAARLLSDTAHTKELIMPVVAATSGTNTTATMIDSKQLLPSWMLRKKSRFPKNKK